MKYAAPAVLAVGIVGIGVAGTPKLLSNFAFFDIREVEVVGLRYLTADQVLDAAHVEETANLLEDLDTIEQRVREIPGVVDVELTRKLPGRLRIAVSERVPVAFHAGDGPLVPLDEGAKVLPYDPTVAPLDLPVVREADSVVTHALGQVLRSVPTLFAIIDHVRRTDGGDVVLATGEQRLIVPQAPSREIVIALAAVRQQILDAGETFTELDGTFEGVVVARGRSR